jgi:hypothetical protein
MLYTELLPKAHQIQQMWHFEMKTFVSFLVHCSSFFVCVPPSSLTLYLSIGMYNALLPRAHQIRQIWHFGMKTFVSFLVYCSSFFVCVLPSSLTLYLSIGMCVSFAGRTWPNCSNILWSKLKYCTQSMQDTIPYHGF